MELQEQLRQIKRALHSMMNGPISQAMRNKGLTYKVNFGVEKPRLEEYAHELPTTYELAAALWKENIRECRLLAGMLMPVEEFPADLADAIHEMNDKRMVEIAAELQDERLADVLQELPEEDQVQILSYLADERAAQVLEEMEPDDAADLLLFVRGLRPLCVLR